MAYLGTPPQSGFITTAKQRVTSSTNNYVDLDHAISSIADVIVFVNFVKQDTTNLSLTTSTRITLGGTLVSSDIVEIHYLGKAVNTQTPGTGTVTNDMLAGSIANSKLANSSITLNGSAVSLGGSATISSGDFVRLNSVTGTGLSDITFDNFSSTYQVYKILGSHTMSVDDAQTRMRVRKSATDQTSSHYRFAFAEPYRSSGGSGISYNTTWNGDHVRITQGSSSADAHPTGFEFTIYSPSDSTRQSACFLESFFYESGGNNIWKAWIGSVWLDSTTGVDITGIKFYPESGNFNNAKYSIYALKDS